jgi:hypothetical protein
LISHITKVHLDILRQIIVVQANSKVQANRHTAVDLRSCRTRCIALNLRAVFKSMVTSQSETTVTLSKNELTAPACSPHSNLCSGKTRQLRNGHVLICRPMQFRGFKNVPCQNEVTAIFYRHLTHFAWTKPPYVRFWLTRQNGSTYRLLAARKA